ncbi:hypothetical protein BOX15_Mlig013558g1 [Macrostomum lignano]|uniref:Tyrosine-protein kinase n=1 Tax=Macrostomum lignano TaxID=282301 RepID=A0A267GW68_9PLAT|nr:hypothetical protein BOX15_Mlig013558g1 [Macrostomum lignano]
MGCCFSKHAAEQPGRRYIEDPQQLQQQQQQQQLAPVAQWNNHMGHADSIPGHMQPQRPGNKFMGPYPQQPIGRPNQPMPMVEPQPPPQQRILVRALYNYNAQNPDDLDFRKDDLMEVLGDTSEPWWYARHQRSSKAGYIPSNYVLIDDGKPTSLSSWFEISRRDADRHLLMPGNPSGTYILRPSSSGHYALSVRVKDQTKENNFMVKHYKIKNMDNGGFYISPRITFNSMQDLLSHYQERTDGLCCKLTIPCPRAYKPPVQFRDIEVNRDCIQLLQKLGNGSFGEVFLGKWNNSVEVAVKTMKPNTMEAQKFISEAQILHRLNHPRIVQILGVCTTGEPIYIITELMVNGALLDYLRKDNGLNLKFENLIDMMAQISDGMAYLESLNFVHRDLRAANILVGDNNWVKVADFGLARMTAEDDIYTADEGAKFPIKWTAPEAAQNRMFSVKSDVWSFGVLMWEIVTYGRAPYVGMANRQVLEEVSKGYRMPNPHSGHVYCDNNIYQLMLECWSANPDSRPTFAYLKDVFENYNVATEIQYVDKR